jgi:hypothetical protein
MECPLIPVQLSALWVFILICTSLFILISNNWRYTIIAFAIQYAGVFGLITVIWPVSMAAVKVIVGWMACSILSAARNLDSMNVEDEPLMSELVLRSLAAGLLWVFVFILAPTLVNWVALPLNLARGSILLLGMGFIQTGMTREPMKIIIGLLTLLSGFEILYSYLEASILVTGLLAAINLSIAFIGSIILTAPGSEEPT